MIEAAMLWNEPNNKSHWAFEADPEWRDFARMISLAGQAIKAETPHVLRVLGGTSPIDPSYIELLENHGAMAHLDVVAIHGFPLDWNHWRIDEWPAKIDSIRAVTDKEVWVTEVGISTFGADEVQEWGVARTAELLRNRAGRVHWYSLFDLPGAWPASTRHKASEGSSYYRHFHMGLIRENGSPKPALSRFADFTPELGVCQWFHFEDPRLHDAVRWLKKLGVKKLRTGLSWADSFRPNCWEWFDTQMKALDDFDVTVTFCFTPQHLAVPGIEPPYTAPPTQVEWFADFCAQMVRRYGGAGHSRPTNGEPEEVPLSGTVVPSAPTLSGPPLVGREGLLPPNNNAAHQEASTNNESNLSPHTTEWARHAAEVAAYVGVGSDEQEAGRAD